MYSTIIEGNYNRAVLVFIVLAKLNQYGFSFYQRARGLQP